MFRLVAGRPVLAGMDLAAQAARETLTAAVGVVTDGTSLTGRIGRAVLDGLLEPRRPRVSTRKVKSPLSRWNKADPHRPACSTPVTALTITVSDPGTTTPPATRQQQCLTGTPRP